MDWTAIRSARPPSRILYGAAWDARRDRLVVFGGMDRCQTSTAVLLSDTWEWDGYVSGPLPNTTAAIGMNLYLQLGFVDQNQPTLPIVSTNGLEMIIGAR